MTPTLLKPGVSGVDELLSRSGLSGVSDRLAEFLLQQRWFGGRGRPITSVLVDDAAVLDDGPPTTLFIVAKVSYRDGDSERYALAVFAGAHNPWEPASSEWRSSPSEEATMPVLGAHSGPVTISDALGDARCASGLWRLMIGEGSIETRRGRLHGRSLGLLPWREGEEAIVPVGGEQSNTSLRRDEREFFKWVRRIDEGDIAEMEMARALAAAGFEHTPGVIGTIEYEVPGEPTCPVVVVQPFVGGARDGWSLATASLGQTDGGASFVAEAARLGTVTAEMHLALASPALPPELRAVPLSTSLLGEWAEQMHRQLDGVMRTNLQAREALGPYRDGLFARFDALTTVKPSGLALRIHGDYHLGQVLRGEDGDWLVIDFGGEPLSSGNVRRSRSSPLRDVAGMLRSIDYAAAASGARERHGAAAAAAWVARCRGDFWRAYCATIGSHPLLPAGDGARVTLCAFEVHKAVYEFAYELSHRPSWASIPLQSLASLAQAEPRGALAAGVAP